jgi:hypothetical protein
VIAVIVLKKNHLLKVKKNAIVVVVDRMGLEVTEVTEDIMDIMDIMDMTDMMV